MKKIKLDKGITIISLIVTIVLILILTTVIVTDTDTGNDYKKYNSLYKAARNNNIDFNPNRWYGYCNGSNVVCVTFG